MSGTLPQPTFATEFAESEDFDLVEMLLAEQQSLTAVERFSAFHEERLSEPAQERYYRDLLPASAPEPGQQYAFRVDLDACSGCKACVVACHTLNGLEEEETWRQVGTLTVGQGAKSRVQHVTTACHHCEDPGCLSGCPVKAYTKDADTGIVRHHDDQCIGCKYCTMMCPYEVPQYSDRLGIVRKCDMCHQRLSVGEAPACVQSCPNEAISIQLVDVAAEPSESPNRLVAGAPLSSITTPSTSYVSRYGEVVNDATPQDENIDEPAENHWPLAVMLVMTQVSVGMLVVERALAGLLWLIGDRMPIDVTRANAVAALVIGVIGLNLASLHLGQPLRAWRVFLGLRTSWLSREAIVLGKYVGALGVATALLWMPTFVQYLPSWLPPLVPAWAANVTLVAAVVLGIAGLFSSAMIYIATKRQIWRYDRTLLRFFGTAVVGGAALSVPWLVVGGAPAWTAATALFAAIIATAGKLLWEWRKHLGPASDGDDSYDRRSRKLTRQRLGRERGLRLTLGGIALGLLAVSLVSLPVGSTPLAVGLTVIAGATLIAGEIAERVLYFASVVYDRMPGTLR